MHYNNLTTQMSTDTYDNQSHHNTLSQGRFNTGSSDDISGSSYGSFSYNMNPHGNSFTALPP